MQKTYQISISGQVQGVGFRPYVYVLAHNYKIKGTVSNNEFGVIIYSTGEEKNILSFYKKLIEKPPVVSRIIHHAIQEIDYKEFEDFQIIASQKGSKLNVQLTPDFAICDDCKKEITIRENRRYLYPFTTCVNCGPRWAITTAFPFERNHTSIDKFIMCEACNNEYTNPLDRRFHSQTNSCQKCGIKIELKDSEGTTIKVEKSEIFKTLAAYIKEGKIVAIKNTSGYLLCCDASNEEIINKLRIKKNRPQKPFAILYPTINLLKEQLEINNKQSLALSSTERPIVIVPKTNFNGTLALTELAPNLNQLGVMLPYSGILQLLSDELEIPIVATSGNIHGSPIISDEEYAQAELGSIVDLFLHHNLNIINPQDDSVVKYSTKFDHEVIFRRSRGYAPNFFNGEYKTDSKIMAMGGHLKSTIAFLPNDYLYISQYLGNLDHYDVYDRFTKTIDKFIKLFEQKPDTILIDEHPAYQSTQYGIELSKKLDAKLIKIQHHKAHFASVLGEHKLFDETERILGVIWDGTGFGEDGQIWGGEFFSYHAGAMKRIAHFEYFDWLAGDKMAREPKLSLLSLADEEMRSLLSEKYYEEEIVLYQTLKKQNKLKTSSVGRLFDAVASILDICDVNTYEGEAAILLENYIENYDLNTCKSYGNVLDDLVIPTQLILKNIYIDINAGLPKKAIIANFLYTLANIILTIAKQNNFNKLAFSGGVFQNTVLIDMLKEMAQNDYELYFNINLAPNDENVSYGQITYHLNSVN
ncbi:MAG: carbamoyltransferase HypF [Aureibaculum sp.]